MAGFSKRATNLTLSGGLVALFALLMILELRSYRDGISPKEFVFEALELGLIITIAAGISHLLQQMRTKEKERRALVRDLHTAREQGSKWRNQAHRYVSGLRSAMNRQFESWGMTKAEKEVALLILKGLSHKEIANVRGTSEATVRQQAQTVYEKSGLSGKAALLSFFLEDLFLPG